MIIRKPPDIRITLTKYSHEICKLWMLQYYKEHFLQSVWFPTFSTLFLLKEKRDIRTEKVAGWTMHSMHAMRVIDKKVKSARPPFLSNEYETRLKPQILVYIKSIYQNCLVQFQNLILKNFLTTFSVFLRFRYNADI